MKLVIGLECLIGKENMSIVDTKLAYSLFFFILVVIYLFQLRNQLLNLLINKSIIYLNVVSSTRRDY